MNVKIISIDERTREAYWHATRSELRNIQRRGDYLVFGGALALLAVLFYNHDRSSQLQYWLVVGGLTLLVILASLWFVTTRKRRVATARGLVCASCSYMPHDTEISDVVESRRCPRCDHSLQG